MWEKPSARSLAQRALGPRHRPLRRRAHVMLCYARVVGAVRPVQPSLSLPPIRGCCRALLQPGLSVARSMYELMAPVPRGTLRENLRLSM